jgi:hypothetical protein
LLIFLCIKVVCLFSAELVPQTSNNLDDDIWWPSTCKNVLSFFFSFWKRKNTGYYSFSCFSLRFDFSTASSTDGSSNRCVVALPRMCSEHVAFSCNRSYGWLLFRSLFPFYHESS